MIKRIGIVVGCSTTPGTNAIISGIVLEANKFGIDVFGIDQGFDGLIHGTIFQINNRAVATISREEGSLLSSSRGFHFLSIEGQQQAIKSLEKSKIDVLIAIGGDGTLQAVKSLQGAGIKAVFIPTTIENDVNCSEYSIGFYSAISTAVNLVDRIDSAFGSSYRCSIVEIPGRSSTSLAMSVAKATNSRCISPETSDSYANLIDSIFLDRAAGISHFVIIMPEGVGNTEELRNTIEQADFTCRIASLGYLLRGGKTSVYDRILGAKFGETAVQLIVEGRYNFAVIIHSQKIKTLELEKAYVAEKKANHALFENF